MNLSPDVMHTLAPDLLSFVPVPRDSLFPIQNLPYGVFRRRAEPAHVGVAIGEQVLDLTVLEAWGVLNVPALHDRRVFDAGKLNPFLALGREVWEQTRVEISRLLRHDTRDLRDQSELAGAALVPQAEVTMELPAEVGDYTDFYSSRDHAANVGAMFRGPDKALNPNWLHLPVAYHGRASSLVVSGTDLHRPWGQSLPANAQAPVFGPSRSLDFELEVGAFIGPGNPLGRPIPIARAEDHLFGLVLVNDWSARDIQAWEYVPLGPFLSKSFGTSLSPWVVTLEALEPFRTAGPLQEPAPLPHLCAGGEGAYDIHLEVYLQSERMAQPQRISLMNYKLLYWSLVQQLAHHASNGCNLRPGDLLASGTISGPVPESRGSLLEIAWRGTQPLQLSSGETRTFLEDGDRVTMTGWCQGKGYRVGFGTVTGKVLPAQKWEE
jgi:fumarylacetoacetase